MNNGVLPLHLTTFEMPRQRNTLDSGRQDLLRAVSRLSNEDCHRYAAFTRRILGSDGILDRRILENNHELNEEHHDNHSRNQDFAAVTHQVASTPNPWTQFLQDEPQICLFTRRPRNQNNPADRNEYLANQHLDGNIPGPSSRHNPADRNEHLVNLHLDGNIPGPSTRHEPPERDSPVPDCELDDGSHESYELCGECLRAISPNSDQSQDNWIQCDHCPQWYHLDCVLVPFFQNGTICNRCNNQVNAPK